MITGPLPKFHGTRDNLAAMLSAGWSNPDGRLNCQAYV
jgi:hypothetical protein